MAEIENHEIKLMIRSGKDIHSNTKIFNSSVVSAVFLDKLENIDQNSLNK